MGLYWQEVLNRMDLTAKGSWFIYLTGAIAFLLSVTVTKNISRREWFLLFGMIGFIGLMVDIILFFILDLMDSGQPSIGGIPDIFMYVIGPASMGVLFLNHHDSPTRLIRILFFSVLSFLIEFILGKIGFLTLKGWKPVYSIPFYLFLFAIFLPGMLKLIRGK